MLFNKKLEFSFPNISKTNVNTHDLQNHRDLVRPKTKVSSLSNLGLLPVRQERLALLLLRRHCLRHPRSW